MAPKQLSRGGGTRRRHSLRWRLPLFFCALVVLMLATFLWITLREVEDALMRAGRDRTQAAAEQVADMLGRSMRALMDENDRLRDDAAIRAFVLNPTNENREAALKPLAPRTPQAFRRIELWNEAGVKILELATEGKLPSGEGPVFYPAGPRPSRPGVSELQKSDKLVFFELVSEVRDGSSPNAARVGYFRRYGRLVTTPGATVRRLVGIDAVVKVGTMTGAWTDMSVAIDAPPAQDPRTEVGEHRAADGQRWVGASADIEGTPWMVWVGFPRQLIVAPARAFMQRMTALALLFVVGSVAFVGILGVRLTQPLHALARAAEEIAAGDYTRRVGTDRRDEIGRLSGAFNTMTDRVEEAYGALKANHEYTQFALAAARIGVWESQLATGQMSCSEGMGLVHGFAAGVLPQSSDAFLAWMHPDDRQSIGDVLRGRGIGRAPFDVQYRAVTPDGKVRWFEGKGKLKVDDHGQPMSVLGVSVDVTDHRRLEGQLRQAQKMEAVGQLAGGVAHDFNNLLTAIVGHGNLVLAELPEQHGVREDVVEILKAGERAAGLTRQLLAFSRRQVMQPEVVGINTVIANIEKLLGRLIEERIAIVTALAPDVNAVKVDPGQLEQVLVNLALNARDAMPDGGTLTIGTANVNLSAPEARDPVALSSGSYVMLSVADTGTGMNAETQAHLFEPFFTTKAPDRGTGLGLATVYGIVEQSGGHIYVYSELGHGTTFKIYLPASAERPAAGPTEPAAPKAMGGTETILVVEDSPQVQTIARRILEQIGYRILVASNGEEALRLLERTGGQLDLVVSDVIMPGMTGPELGREVSARYPGVKVLFTSGYSTDAIVRHGVLEPGTMFIEKPYAPVALARKVREVLAQGNEAVPVPNAAG